MRVREALEQLDAIHDHLAKAEEYRGFRVPGVALAGAVGLLAAAAQPKFPLAGEPAGFVAYWVAVAAVCALLGGGAAVQAYAVREDEFARRRTRRVGAQFLPCVAAGAVLTVGFVRAGVEFVPFLPGVWAVVFGLGMISARPYLPRGVGLVALFYLVIGSMLVCRATAAPDLSGWAVGGVFGPGHLATAAVLWAREKEPPMADDPEPSGAGRYSYEGLDRVLHEKARLGILTALVARPLGLAFTELARLCSLTDGNLSRHLDVLAEAGLVEIKKGFDRRRPLTTCRLTAAGRRRFREYLAELERVLHDAAAEEDAARERKPRPGLAGA